MLQLWSDLSDGNFVAIEPFGHSVLGSLIGFLLVMRMNASNSRFWEGRSHWGAIVNASRNLSRAAAAYTDDGKYFAGLVAGYAITLKQSLRDSRDSLRSRRISSQATLPSCRVLRESANCGGWSNDTLGSKTS